MIFALGIYGRHHDYAFGAAIDVETDANQKNTVTVTLGGRLLNIQCGLPCLMQGSVNPKSTIKDLSLAWDF